MTIDQAKTILALVQSDPEQKVYTTSQILQAVQVVATFGLRLPG